MLKRVVFSACLVTAAAATPAFAASTFQNTCSDIHFAYNGNAAALSATCLRANGTANVTSLALQGIGNNNGNLVQSSGPATFQQSCGNIRIVVDNTSNVTLTAFCRDTSGSSHPTSLPLNNISNNNGTLTQ